MFSKSDCPRYVVNLDDKPQKRWTAIVEAYKDRLPAAFDLIDQILGSGFVAGAADTVLAGLTKAGRIYYGKELNGVAKASGISLGKVAILQVAYEAFAACTSIVCDTAAGDGNHVPFHIRTMDWEMQALQSLTIEVEFVRGGRPLFVATTWPGYVGVLTGMRPSSFAISTNYRRTHRGSQSMLRGVVENMLRGLAQSWPVSFLVREALETCLHYQDAVGALSASDLMAPTYLIVSGTEKGQGVVISRERKGAVSLPELELWSHGPLVQVNMDHWRGNIHPATAYRYSDVADQPLVSAVEGEREGFFDSEHDSGDWQDICDSRERRAVARAAILNLNSIASASHSASGAAARGKGGSEGAGPTRSELWLLLSTPPCLAEDTVYTVSMCAATGQYCTRTHVTAEQRELGARRWGGLARAVCREVRAALRARRETAGAEDHRAGPRRQ